MRTTATTVAAMAAACLSASAMADFGLIPVPMTSGTGVGNDGYFNGTYQTSIGWLNIGIKAHEYRNGNMPAGSTTQSSVSGGGTWLNLDAQNRYTAIAGIAANKPSWNPAAPSWGFTWSIASDPSTDVWGRPTAGQYRASMTITRPDTVAVNIFSDVDASGVFGGDPTNMVWQNNWNLGYLGVFGSGVDANTVGLSQVVLPPKTTIAVVKRMSAVQETLANLEESRGQAEADAIKSQAASQADTIRNFADQWAAEIEAVGNTEATRYYEQMKKEADLAIFLAWLDTLKASLSGNTTFVTDMTKAPFHMIDLDAATDANGIPQPAKRSFGGGSGSQK